MHSAYLARVEKLDKLSPKDFIQTLLEDLYPYLFTILSDCGHRITALNAEGQLTILKAAHQKVSDEIDEMYRKEKLVLFPFILKLADEHSVSETCKPFKTVKTHFTSMLTVLQTIKPEFDDLKALAIYPDVVDQIERELLDFEYLLVNVYKRKETTLFKPFKSCSGCSSL